MKTFYKIVLASVDNEGVFRYNQFNYESTSNNDKQLTVSGRVADTDFGGVIILANREP
jgi:hypothetical protein